MLSDGKPIRYWDACVPLSYINGYADRLPDIEGLLSRSGKDFHIITSILSITEVAFAATEQNQKQLDPDQEEKISKLWRLGSPIQLVELFQLITEKARTLMRSALEKGWSLKPADAIHLATADHFKVSRFDTYDPALKKYQEITETHFQIDVPMAPQPLLSLSDAPKEAVPSDHPTEVTSAEPEQAVAAGITPSDTAAVSGSGSGHVESETTNKINPKFKLEKKEEEGPIRAITLEETGEEKPKPADKGGPSESDR